MSNGVTSVATVESIDMTQMGRAARVAGRRLAAYTSKAKNDALHVIADELEAQADRVLVGQRGRHR